MCDLLCTKRTPVTPRATLSPDNEGRGAQKLGFTPRQTQKEKLNCDLFKCLLA